MMCLPAAVSHNHGIFWSTSSGSALTCGMSLDAWLTWAETSGPTEAATLAGALPFAPSLANTRGGGPWYFWESECKNAHCLALHILYA